MQQKTQFQFLLPAILFLLLISCTGTDNPVVEINEFIAAAEKNFERKDTGNLKKLISNNYHDSKNFSRQDIARIIAGYFLRRPSIYVLTNPREISLAGNQTTARLTLYVAVSREPLLETDLELVQAERYRLEVELQKEGGDWLLTSAALNSISANEFIDSYN